MTERRHQSLIDKDISHCAIVTERTRKISDTDRDMTRKAVKDTTQHDEQN